VLDDVRIDEAERKAALRRAQLVLAAGGDPHRELGLDDVAVARLAAELDTPERRSALDGALAALDARGLPTVTAGVATLRAEPELAWRAFALALLADALADE